MRKFRSLISFLFAITLVSCENSTNQYGSTMEMPHINDDEQKALMEIYNCLHFEDNNSHHGWDKWWQLDWQGVTFRFDSISEEYYVVKLYLGAIPDRRDSYIPDVFASFTRMESFSLKCGLNKNELNIPESLCSLPLKYLEISNAGGKLPTNFTDLASSLEELYIYSCPIGNEIIERLEQLTKLKYCELENCGLSGKVPFINYANFENDVVFSFPANDYSEMDWEYFNSLDNLPKLPYVHHNKIKGTPEDVENIIKRAPYSYKHFMDYFRRMYDNPIFDDWNNSDIAINIYNSLL